MLADLVLAGNAMGVDRALVRRDCSRWTGTNPKKVYGSHSESLLQPQWSPGGDLYVISDKTNWWNLYRVQGDELAPVLALEEECAVRPWVLGLRSYHFSTPGSVEVLSQKDGVVRLHRIDLSGGGVQSNSLPLTSFAGTSALAGGASWPSPVAIPSSGGVHRYRLGFTVAGCGQFRYP